MSKSRASIFGDEQEKGLDVSSFAPRTVPDIKAPDAEQVRAVTQAANYRSREPAAPKPQVQKRRVARQYRTGRNVQLNLKASQETVDAFYAISDKNAWVLGKTLEHAIQALQRELKMK